MGWWGDGRERGTGVGGGNGSRRGSGGCIYGSRRSHGLRNWERGIGDCGIGRLLVGQSRRKLWDKAAYILPLTKHRGCNYLAIESSVDVPA